MINGVGLFIDPSSWRGLWPCTISIKEDKNCIKFSSNGLQIAAKPQFITKAGGNLISLSTTMQIQHDEIQFLSSEETVAYNSYLESKKNPATSSFSITTWVLSLHGKACLKHLGPINPTQYGIDASAAMDWNIGFELVSRVALIKFGIPQTMSENEWHKHVMSVVNAAKSDLLASLGNRIANAFK